jgi:enoyl-CoA hydratase/carnithine racemase
LVAKTLRLIYESPKVVISAAHGKVVAGGAALLLVSDLVLVAEGTKIGFPETRRGIAPGLVATFMLRKLRACDVNELLLAGNLVDGQRALAMGLVNRVASKEHLMEEAVSLAHSVALAGPEALARTKSFIRSLPLQSLDQDLEKAIAMFEEMRLGSEAKEGRRASLEKRHPNWAPERNP